MHAVLERELVRINQQLDPHELLSCLVIDHKPWTVESGFITPTLKVKRNQIEAVYGPSFETWSELYKSIVWLKASAPSTHS